MNWRPGRRAGPLLAAAAGALAAIAHTPFGVLPGLLGYALLMHLIDRADEARPLRSAFWRGWLAGLAYFLIGCWWIAEAFFVDPQQTWMAPFAVGLTAAGLALFWGLAALAYRWLRPPGMRRILVFAGLLTAFEWLRGHVLTGFPWDLPGETWRAGSAPSQAASLVGAYGLTWITVAIACAFAAPFGGDSRRRSVITVGVAVAALVLLYGYGVGRLASAAPMPAHAPLVRLIQANVGELAKYDEASFRTILWRYLKLTATPSAQSPDLVIWPEGALPDTANDFLAPGGWPARLIADSPRPGQVLMLGAARVEGPETRPLYFNSLISLVRGPQGLQITSVYDKHHLVPFGEYLPLRSVLEPLGFRKLTHIGDGFSDGPPPAPMRLPGLPPVQPLICYEVLFPELVRHAVNDHRTKPQWLVNISNDAWFGATSGPLQHLNIASYRSIENGLPMMRATPTGVSAVVDAYGRSTAAGRIGLGRAAVIDVQLPNALASTAYRKLGSLPLLLLMAVSALAIVRGRTIAEYN